MVHCLLCALTAPWQYNISETLCFNRWSYCLGFPQPHFLLQVTQRKDRFSHTLVLQSHASGKPQGCLWSLKQLCETHRWIIVCCSLQGTHTTLGSDGSCMILLCPHQALGPADLLPDFCSEPAACSFHSWTNNQEPGFLLKANHYCNF